MTKQPGFGIEKSKPNKANLTLEGAMRKNLQNDEKIIIPA
jgi:hypothetical protein